MSTDDEVTDDFTANFHLRDSRAGRVTLRQVALGFKPIILIEPDEDEGDLVLNIDATDLGFQELKQILEAVILFIDQGVEDGKIEAPTESEEHDDDPTD